MLDTLEKAFVAPSRNDWNAEAGADDAPVFVGKEMPALLPPLDNWKFLSEFLKVFSVDIMMITERKEKEEKEKENDFFLLLGVWEVKLFFNVCMYKNVRKKKV